jgi:retinol dehydrogenase-12
MAPGTLSRALTQFFPPKPQFTEKDVGELSGNVYIVTGANSGLGKEVSRILYLRNARVYMTGRSQDKIDTAIKSIKGAVRKSTGSLHFLPLDFDDLSTVKASADRFLAAENRLHVLFSNAGFQGGVGPSIKTVHGYERHLQVNCLGSLLFFQLLAPVLTSTACDPATPPNTVRVVFLSSFAAEMFSEKNTGFRMDNLDYHDEKPNTYRYGISKLGAWAYAVEASKKHKDIIFVAANPGNIRTDLFRDQSSLFRALTNPVNYPTVNGAYTEIWAGLSPTVTAKESGSYAVPFGRIYPMRGDLEAAAKSESEGGNGSTKKFWDWSEQQISNFA